MTEGGAPTEDDTTPADGPGRGSLQGRTALVTGASGGIGAAIVQALLEAGVAVTATSRSPQPRRLAALDESLRRKLTMRVADMADLGALPGLVEEAETRTGHLDVLVLAAGLGEVHSLEELTLEQWQSTLTVNLTAPFVLARTALPAMQQRGWGRILFLSSAAAYTGGFVGPHYAASKGGVNALTHALAAQGAAEGVTVNAIAPALIGETGMIAGMPDSTPTPPVGRLGRPAEVADLALAVLGNPYLTAQVLLLDGGLRPS